MSGYSLTLAAWAILHLAVLVRALAVEGRAPGSRAAWALVLILLPALGIVLYLLVGEPWMSRRLQRTTRRAGVIELDEPFADLTVLGLPERLHAAFATCERIAGGGVTRGNRARLPADSHATINEIIADIDAARSHVHLLFYIWLTDGSGLRMIEALERAVRRGVTCRVIVDAVGSRALLRSRHWKRMGAAGIQLCASLRPSFGLGLVLGSRLDLRNHRKIVVVDDGITWCGSQNAADPEFLIKARYGPWIDLMLRFEGPVARQNQRLFLANWRVEVGEALPLADWPDGTEPDACFAAIAFGTGPTLRRGAMSEAFVALLHGAAEEVVITNPYFGPGQALFSALLACARRGVRTVLILPARNDSWTVAAISQASYRELLEAGVEVFEHGPGLLHAKTMVVDRVAALVGSANMDQRSLELNFENNILLYSERVAGEIRTRQEDWIAQSRRVEEAEVRARRLPRRIADNLATILSPIA